ncbi:MAG: ProQ/FINO family protein, partial [Betaproteobacteria bacterium]
MHDPNPHPADPTPPNAAETAPTADALPVAEPVAEPVAAPAAESDAAPAATGPAPVEAAAESVAEPAIEPPADGGADAAAAAPSSAAATPDAGTPAGARAEPTLADTARLLAEQFPALFGPGVVKPVKLRIQADIQQRAPGVFTKKALSLFLHRHTTGSAYLRALVAAETRFDLDGQPAGEIAAEHKEAARVEVERRRAIVEAKKEAARAAARAAREAARPPRPPRPERGPQPGG